MLKRTAVMTVQELIDKLEDLKKEFGDRRVVIRDPYSNTSCLGHSVTELDIWGGKETVVYNGSWSYKAIKVEIFED